MPPTIISKSASNWVDRGEPSTPTLKRRQAKAIIVSVNQGATSISASSPCATAQRLGVHLDDPEGLVAVIDKACSH